MALNETTRRHTRQDVRVLWFAQSTSGIERCANGKAVIAGHPRQARRRAFLALAGTCLAVAGRRRWGVAPGGGQRNGTSRRLPRHAARRRPGRTWPGPRRGGGRRDHPGGADARCRGLGTARIRTVGAFQACGAAASARRLRLRRRRGRDAHRGHGPGGLRRGAGRAVGAMAGRRGRGGSPRAPGRGRRARLDVRVDRHRARRGRRRASPRVARSGRRAARRRRQSRAGARPRRPRPAGSDRAAAGGIRSRRNAPPPEARADARRGGGRRRARLRHSHAGRRGRALAARARRTRRRRGPVRPGHPHGGRARSPGFARRHRGSGLRHGRRAGPHRARSARHGRARHGRGRAARVRRGRCGVLGMPWARRCRSASWTRG